ncbi:hypothetical protein DFH08DRAFT_979519 [Mycena albidolilacea]|uniref:Uncharacterized protein n=1 Tax=Mycena albidolilacea TaxID=1033008 RepID=A0AAD6YXC7_9AGAR|nr:hypothetical protein DFH08DRAFT_979519 [Mycena albidolilacea]
MEALPAAMHLLIKRVRVWFKVPNFHLPPHVPACHSPYSFHYMWGAGRTHSETIEQNWEFTNGAAASTKMMGVGTRHATLEDLSGFHNWRRQVAWRKIFARQMVENVKEGQVHRDVFEAFDAALRETAPEMVEGWKKWMHQWESRQHTDGTESPFELKETVATLHEIKNKLAKEELLQSEEGTEVERKDTPSMFIVMELEIEDIQRNLTINVKAICIANPTDVQSLDFLKRHTALLKRIQVFHKLQQAYMPNLRRFLSATQRQIWDSEVERHTEAIWLFLPSDILDATKRMHTCTQGLPGVEADLRIGEARKALHTLRQVLRTHTMTYQFCLRHCTGQCMLTRDQGVLRQINLKIRRAKLRYRYVQNALKRLKGDRPWERELQVLEDTDVWALNERALMDEGKEQRKAVHDYEDVVEEGGVAVPEEPTEVELPYVWSGAKPMRMQRWQENIVLVEEMHRTIEYGYWSAREWERRANGRAGSVDDELLEGLTAYAREQQQQEVKISGIMTEKWAGIRLKGRAYLECKTALGVDIVVPLNEDDAGEEDDEEEEGPPDYDDEGDDKIVE